MDRHALFALAASGICIGLLLVALLIKHSF